MISFPYCKINLGLRIISKRDDGYHNIETCFYPVPWTDVLEIIPSETISFTNSGINVPGQPEENLCLKAYYLLRDDYDLPPVNMQLHKVVPLGAGLGGGSSDGAHVLVLLNTIFKLKLTDQQFTNYTSRLGSDCSFFLKNQPMIGTGRGELLTPATVSLKGCTLIIVKPGVHLSTAEAYKGVVPGKQKKSLSEIIEKNDISHWKDLLVNDFEESVMQRYPVIQEIKNKLYHEGAVYASMSGSGSSVFGIFNNDVDLRTRFPEHTYWSGTL